MKYDPGDQGSSQVEPEGCTPRSDQSKVNSAIRS